MALEKLKSSLQFPLGLCSIRTEQMYEFQLQCTNFEKYHDLTDYEYHVTEKPLFSVRKINQPTSSYP